jgi:hypothetical protein
VLACLDGRVPDLSPEDERKLDQLRRVYDDVRESPLTITQSSAVGRIARTALVPTLSFLALAAVEGYVERVLDEFLDWLGSLGWFASRSNPASTPGGCPLGC